MGKSVLIQFRLHPSNDLERRALHLLQAFQNENWEWRAIMPHLILNNIFIPGKFPRPLPMTGADEFAEIVAAAVTARLAEMQVTMVSQGEAVPETAITDAFRDVVTGMRPRDFDPNEEGG